ncbi:MAG: N-6 DNA methylase [Geminicoccaceae bacterium]|nr:N-6 DNA methylase [Geminicoccaceae bacterium]
MSIHQDAAAFADAVKRALSQPAVSAAPEDQLKTPAKQFIESVGARLGRRMQTPTEVSPVQGAGGRPDIGVVADGLLCGYVELKRPGLGADPTRLRGEQNRSQWAKFRALPNLVYTDGNAWTLFRAGERAASVRIADDLPASGAAGLDGGAVGRLGALLQDFLTWEPVVPHEPQDLARFLAPLAHLLREEVHTAVRQDGTYIANLAAEWRAYLFPDADDNRFADAYAQTLTYAMLLARVSGAENLEPDAAADALDRGNGLLAQTLRLLAQRDARREIDLGFGPLKRALEALDPRDFLERAGRDPWLYFYEDFLAAYDRDLRNAYGVYYTPQEVVRCQVNLVSDLLRRRFNKRYAFADEGVTFIDPAVGTGTYPLVAIDHALELARERGGEGAIAGCATQLANNLFGFEILVGPYAVAHLRIGQRLKDAGAELPDGRLRVYLADTLDSPNEHPAGLVTAMGRKLVEERERARRVKAEQDILVCLGNPPYDRQQIAPDDAETRRKGGWVREGDAETPRPILEDFLAPVRAAGQAVHLKNVYNDYVYFWRWALWKLFERQDGRGIVSFITASSYLVGPGFAGMREEMRRAFDELWLIDLGGDNRGARRSENVFAIQTPVAVAVGVRIGNGDRDTPARVRYAQVEGTRAAKLARLAGIGKPDDVAWRDCPDGWGDRFLPVGTGDYFAWPALTDVFPWQHSGVQFKRSWPISHDAQTLTERWKFLLKKLPEERAVVFVETRDRKIDRIYDDGLPGSNATSLYRCNDNNKNII